MSADDPAFDPAQIDTTEEHVVCTHCGAESRSGYVVPSSLCEEAGHLEGGHRWRPKREVDQSR